MLNIFTNLFLQIAWALVLYAKCDEDLIENLAEMLNVDEKHILFSLMKDSEDLDNHSPDIMLIVHHKR